ncbi:hypothetical protein BD779DRAFT_1487243 [Infundibulicybe gibba]|nr:hypothetical protein BD779DRAFT_1487243 [Infundibulicybe gibba]
MINTTPATTATTINIVLGRHEPNSTTSSSPSVFTSPTATTFTAFSQSIATTSSALSFSSSTAVPDSSPKCLGHGFDASVEGLIAAVVLPTAVGLFIWLLFAILRPRFRQLYALREWFVQPDLRPKPLGSSLTAFLFPHVPLVPAIDNDVSDAGRSAALDAQLFPSDDQLNQRALWTSLLIVLGWRFPLYLVSTPCLAHFAPPAIHSGAYSVLQDLSLLRLLELVDAGALNSNPIRTRAEPSGPDHTHTRIIILTALTLVAGVLPALWKIIKELNRAVEFRHLWMEFKCEGKEMAWLSATRAPGLVGWGEKRVKDFLLKSGLSSAVEPPRRSRGGRNGRAERQQLSEYEQAYLEVDVQSLFSIGDTQQLAMLIDERDEILENLEIAETRYIASFRTTTPDPSIADYQPPPPSDRPYISRPLPLAPGAREKRGRRRRAVNPAFAASSLAPTSFVAPSQYYKLRGVQGVSGGRFVDSQPTFSDSINSRVIGSRFQEVNRNSVAFGRLPLGSHVKVERSGQLGPGSPPASITYPQIPDPRLYGPNFSIEYFQDGEGFEEVVDDDWVDLTKNAPGEFDTDFNGMPPAGPSNEEIPAARRETFPLRSRGGEEPESMAPPHLRLQPAQPFVRPLDGMNYGDLGDVYADITQWRSRLKAINGEIAEVQRDRYNDIADGARIKGWLMVGKGLRFLHGVEMIEGRAKEDIRWDVLQNERSKLDLVVLWTIVGMVVVLLAAGVTAACGLALSTAPDVAHFLPFLQPILNAPPLASGLASILVPAVAATLFITVALALVNWAVNVHGSISISGGQLLVFKATFYILTSTAAIWLITAGALIFAIEVFSSSNTSTPNNRTTTVANGSVYMSVLALAMVINAAIIFPGLLLLQPFRLWRVTRAERNAVTPRQRFRAVYPRTYNPSFAIGACILAIVFASTFSMIFPLIGPAVTILLLLTLIAHRYLVGYVYARTHSQTGGMLQIWLLKRLGTLLSFQPILLGLIFLSRRIFIEGGVLLGVGVFVILFVEIYAGRKMRLPGRKTLSPITQDSLERFASTAKTSQLPYVDDEQTSLVSSARGTRTRGSMASVLEMMSLTLAVMPSPSPSRGPVPLQTETLDDLTATERAARTHPDAPPHLPPLPFTDHAEEMSGILYAPELIAPQPIVWLPNDAAGVARSEAVDLQKYHNLQVTLDVRAKEDVMPRRSSSAQGRTSR